MILPGVLEKDYKDAQERLKAIAGYSNWVHVDIMDGTLTPEKTFEPSYISVLDQDFPNKIEVHLMVDEPLNYLEHCKGIKKVITQYEAKDVAKFITEARKQKMEVGLSFNLNVSAEEIINAFSTLKPNYVQIMGVELGASGQKLQEKALESAVAFNREFPYINLQIDGGVNELTLDNVLESGADHLVITSGLKNAQTREKELFETLNSKETINQLAPLTKKKIRKVAFLGGSSWVATDQVYKDAYETAKLLAQEGIEIVDGGGPGVMRAATLGAEDVGGRTLAVTYRPNKIKKNYEGVDLENPFDEEIITLDYFDRTKIMLINSDVHIVFNGSTGTISEFGMTWASSRIHEENRKPIVLFGEFWHDILKVIYHSMLIRPGEMEFLKIATSPQEVLDYIKSIEP